jgi:hypothetical protein
LLWNAPAHAAPRVVLVAYAEKSAEEAAAWQQLRAELTADGFEVLTLHSAQLTLEEEANHTGSFAAVRLVHAAHGLAAEVWIQDRDTGKTMLHRVSAQGRSPEAARDLALRTAELLGASLLVLSVTTSEAPEAARRFGVWLGAALVGHPGGLSTGVAPGAAIQWRATRNLGAELRLVMPVLVEESSVDGRTEVDQELALIGLRAETPNRGLPFVMASVGVGGYRIGVRGKPTDGLVGRSAARIVAASAFGAGVGLHLLRSPFDLNLVLREDVILLTPRPVLLFATAPLAEAGQPMLTLSAGLEAVW